jgi:hypothetical protein
MESIVPMTAYESSFDLSTTMPFAIATTYRYCWRCLPAGDSNSFAYHMWVLSLSIGCFYC